MIGDAESMEAMAILKGAQVAKNTRLWPIEVEYDAVNVINLLNENIASRCEIMCTIPDICKLISEGECAVERAIPREYCNIVGHMSTMMASSFENNPQIWMDDVTQKYHLL